MADMCPTCHSGDTQAGLDRSFCLNCGGFFHVKEGRVVVTDADETFPPRWDGVEEPQTKPGGNLPVASQPGSSPQAVQQAGAPPQTGLEGVSGHEVDPVPVTEPVVPPTVGPEDVLHGEQPPQPSPAEQMEEAAAIVEGRSAGLEPANPGAVNDTPTPVDEVDAGTPGSLLPVDAQNARDAHDDAPAKDAPKRKRKGA